MSSFQVRSFQCHQAILQSGGEHRTSTWNNPTPAETSPSCDILLLHPQYIFHEITSLCILHLGKKQRLTSSMHKKHQKNHPETGASSFIKHFKATCMTMREYWSTLDIACNVLLLLLLDTHYVVVERTEGWIGTKLELTTSAQHQRWKKKKLVEYEYS